MKELNLIELEEINGGGLGGAITGGFFGVIGGAAVGFVAAGATLATGGSLDDATQSFANCTVTGLVLGGGMGAVATGPL